MPGSNPPDQPDRARAGLPGEGWDDGRGGSSGDRPGGRRSTSSAGDGRRSLPRWLVPAIGGAVLVLVVLIVVVGGGGGDRKDAGPCLTDLMANLPETTRFVSGTDLVQARSSDYADDGSLEDLGRSQAETGALPDALSARFRYNQLLSADDFTARTGVKPDQIDCSLTGGGRSVLSGSFDVAEVNGSTVADSGNLAASEDRVAYTEGDSDPKLLLEPRDGGGLASNDDAVRVVESLRDGGAYSLVLQVGNPDAEKRARAAGLGVATGEGDDKALVVAWAFTSADAARAGRAGVVERINAAIRGTSSITSDDLEIDGSLVTATLDTRKPVDLQAVVGRGPELIPGD